MAKTEERNEPGTAARRPLEQRRAVRQRVEDEERDPSPRDHEGNEATHSGCDDAEQPGQELREDGWPRLDPSGHRRVDVLREGQAQDPVGDRVGDVRQAADERSQLLDQGVEDQPHEDDERDDQREDRDQRATPARDPRPLQPVHQPVHQEDEDQADDVRRQRLLGEDHQHRQRDEDAAEDHRMPGRWELHAPRGAWRGGGSRREWRWIDQLDLRSWFGAPVV